MLQKSHLLWVRIFPHSFPLSLKKGGNINNQTGDIGEAKVLSKFVELGIEVYIPFSNSNRCDLIANLEGGLQRIQVKSSLKIHKGRYRIKLVKDYSRKSGDKKHIYSREDIDFYALYNIERDKVLLLPVEIAPTHNITIEVGSEREKKLSIENFI